MWKYLRVVVILTLIVASTAQAQDSERYFPLEIDNSWQYWTPPYYPETATDTIWRGFHSISETVVVDDTTYFLAEYPFSFADTLREDSLGRIWARLDNRDRLLFDFTLEEGESYAFPFPYDDLVFEVTIRRGVTARVAGGDFTDSITLLLDDPDYVDEEYYYTFAPDIGIVRASAHLGDYVELFEAWSDGSVITSIENPSSRRRGVSLSVYPNPTRGPVHINIDGGPLVRAQVYDILGRELWRSGFGECTLSPCDFSWDAGSLPSGTYFIRTVGDGWIESVPITVQR